MKRIITFLLCLNIVLSAAACTKADRPDNIDNSSQPGVSETAPTESEPENEIYYEIEKFDDTTSKYYVYGEDGTVLLDGETDRPIEISVSGSIADIAITIDENKNTTHRYYDAKSDRLSEEFSYVAASSGNLVAYMEGIEESSAYDDSRVLIVRDMFDKDIFYKSFTLDWAPAMNNPIASASFTESEGEISVIYYSERPSIRFYTTLPVRNDSVDCESKALADYDSILEAYRMMIDSFDTVNTNPHALAYELFGLSNNMEIEWFLDFYQSAYLLFPGRGKGNPEAPYYKQKCGYAIKDLNGDGKDELVLLNSNYVIVAIFSTFNGKPVMFGNYNESNYAWIDGDGRIHEIEKGESGTSSHKVYCGIGFELICEFGTSENDEYYQIKNGKKVGITKEEYLSLSDLYGDYSSTATRQVEDFIPFTPLFDKSEISKEEALDIAKEYWKKNEIEKNGYVVAEAVSNYAPDTVYIFVIKHRVDTGDSFHYSTFDEVWVDKITGEATPPYDTKPGLMFDYDEVLWCYKYAVDYYNLDSYKSIDDLIDRFIHIYGERFLNETEKSWFIKIATSGYILHPGRYVDHRLENNNARGYAKKDLNGDGVDELVLLNSDYTIVALFSMSEGKPVLLQEFWDRCKGMIDKNGYVHIFGSGGADVQSHEIYRIADGGGSLELLFEFGLDGHELINDVAVIKYYKIENGEKKYITEEEYNTIREQSNEYLGNKSRTEVTKADSGLQFRSLFSPTLNFSTYENMLDSLRFMTSMYNYYKIGEAKREDFEYRYDLTTEENREMYEMLDELVYTWYPPALGASSSPENAFAYAIKDLDGDDIDELIIIEGDRCDAIAIFTEKDGRIIFDNSYSFNRPSGKWSLKLAYWKNTVGLNLRPLYKNSVAFDLDYIRREALDAIAWALTEEQHVWVDSSEEHIYLTDYVANTPSGKKPLSEIEDIKYAFVDMNGDTVDELIIDCGELIMLKSETPTVYLYQLSSDQASKLNTVEFLTLDELYGDMISPIYAIEIGREYWKDRSLEVSLGIKSAYYTESLGDAPDDVYIVQLLERDSYNNPTCIDEIWVDKATGNIQSPYGAK